MNTERLLRLAALLEADAANPNGIKFALDTWGHDAKLETLNLHTMPYDEIMALKYPKDIETIPVDCNTAACAMGLAAISGAFKDDGLGWRVLAPGYGRGELIPTFGEFDGFEAACAFFGIDLNTTSQLFDPTHYDVIKGADAELAVASRIRGLVDGTWTPSEPEDDDEYSDFDED